MYVRILLRKKFFIRLTCVIFFFNISGVKMALVEFQSITRCLKWWIMFFCFYFYLVFVLFCSCHWVCADGDQLKIGIKESLRVPITRDPVKDEKEEINDICSCCCCFLCIREVLKTIEHTFERLFNIFTLLLLFKNPKVWNVIGLITQRGHFPFPQLILQKWNWINHSVTFFCTNYSFINLSNN